VVGNGSATITNVWDAEVIGKDISGQQVDTGYEVLLVDISVPTWWETNIPNIFNSVLWTIVDEMPTLE